MMKPEETVDFHIKAAWHSIFKMYNQLAAKYDLSQAIGFVLLNIDEKHGAPATKIAPLMGMEATSLSRLLKSMEEKELIYRKSDESDKRSVRIFLTEKGGDKRRIAKRVVKGFNKKVLEEIPAEKIHTFFEVMKAIQEKVEEYKNEGVKEKSGRN